MTFQQLEYIVAVDKSRHFVNAATACGVTQSTLSSTIAKLEQEIDVIIFDRSKHPIEPTPMGKRIIQQAEVILHNSSQLRAMVQNEREEVQGQLQLGMVQSVAPVLFPQFGRWLSMQAPSLQTHIHERMPHFLIEALQRSELDMIIVDTADLRDTNLLSIDLWTERFMLYAADAHPLHNRENVRPEEMMDGNIWTLRSFHDHYTQLTEVTHQSTLRSTYLESGSLQTLIAAVDANGGFTLLPEIFS
ncbi:MAG: LysR family transcriptional regulator, partial [Bacteroidales bacterium]|nr:LysR family transcriptional regulator [Bacteroidales bacterium]